MAAVGGAGGGYGGASVSTESLNSEGCQKLRAEFDLLLQESIDKATGIYKTQLVELQRLYGEILPARANGVYYAESPVQKCTKQFNAIQRSFTDADKPNEDDLSAINGKYNMVLRECYSMTRDGTVNSSNSRGITPLSEFSGGTPASALSTMTSPGLGRSRRNRRKSRKSSRKNRRKSRKSRRRKNY